MCQRLNNVLTSEPIMKILKIWLALTLLLVGMASAKAQKQTDVAYRVWGTVKDSLTNEGEPYATISIYRKGSEEKPVKLAAADADGKFSVDATGHGDYVLVVRSVSREPLRRTYTVSASNKAINMGTLLVSDSKTELKGVEVVAYKPLVKADIDKLTYSVEDDPEQQTNTVMGMLRKVPMVTVDGQDNIKVNGNSSFKIYVNGKPNNMMTKNPKEVLKSMPASSIKKIEVITNPGPKYDAEGVGGILNIITEGKTFEGYSATFTAAGGNRGLGTGAYATVKSGKFTLSGHFYESYDYQGNVTDNTTQQFLDGNGQTERQTLRRSSARSHTNWLGANLEASYEIDTLRLLTASFSINRLNFRSRSGNNVSSMLSASGAELYGYSIKGRQRGAYDDISGGIDYQRSFKTPERLLTFSYRLESNPSWRKDDVNYQSLRSGMSWADYLLQLRDQRVDGDQSTTEHTFQIDYTTPFAKHHTLETGAKYIMRRNNAVNDEYDAMAGTGEEKQWNADNSSDYKHRNDILAAYLGYGLQLSRWSGRLGLRYEHTLQKVEYIRGRGADFTKNFDDLVPSAKIGYKISDTQNISLNYKMRISRPGIWYLNPYLDATYREDVSQGNPNLDSEKNHSIELQYGNFAQKLSFNITVGGNMTRNSIQSVQRLVKDTDIKGFTDPVGKDVLYTTYYNMGVNKGMGFSGYVNWQPFTNTRLTANIWGGYNHYSDGQTLKNHGWMTSMYYQLEQTIAKTWTASASIYKSTPSVTLQGKNPGFFSYDLTLKKTMLDSRLDISLTASNPFRKRMHMDSSSYGDSFRTQSRIEFPAQRYTLSLSYRIGQLKSGVKKAERTIENDDVKKGGEKK